MQITLLGDMILSGRLEAIQDPRYLAVIERIGAGDIVYGHLETLFHDYIGDQIYPAGDAGWLWMRADRAAAEYLHRIGVRLVSTASNHTLDYSYGGLRSTWRTLDELGIAHAGSGEDLAAARAPAIVDIGGQRVALVSMSTTFAEWQRAAAPLPPVAGRPGLNPLGWEYLVGDADLDDVMSLYQRLGAWIRVLDSGLMEVNPPGRHNSLLRFRPDGPGRGVRLGAWAPDWEGNLAAVRAAREVAECIVVHLHNHEWDPARGLGYPPTVVTEFGRAAVEAGAACVFAQGSHAPFRGVEVYRGVPIIYDAGDFVEASDDASAMPADLYLRQFETAPEMVAEPDLARAKAVRRAVYGPADKPRGGYRSAGPPASFVAELCVDEQGRSSGLTLVPVRLTSVEGVPGVPVPLTRPEMAQVVDSLRKLSEPFGTEFDVSPRGIEVIGVGAADRGDQTVVEHGG